MSGMVMTGMEVSGTMQVTMSGASFEQAILRVGPGPGASFEAILRVGPGPGASFEAILRVARGMAQGALEAPRQSSARRLPPVVPPPIVWSVNGIGIRRMKR